MSLSNKRILFVAPASIPVKSAEGIVNMKLLKVLSQEGYIIDVISKDIKSAPYTSKEELSDLGIKLNSLHVINVDNRINFKSIIYHILTFLKFGIVYKGSHWAYLALKKALILEEKFSHDVIITKSYPSELVGYYFKKNKNKKWIATWNDPFPQKKYPAPYGEGVKAKLPFLVKNILSLMSIYPDIHIFPSDRLRKYMLQYLSVDLSRTRVIPHITFPGDTNIPESTSGHLNIIHTGNLGYPRDPSLVLLALRDFVAEYPEAKLQVCFLGIVDEKIKELINEYNLYSYINILPPLDYRKSLEVLNNYHVSMIIEAPCEEGIFLPTKVGDYMQCKQRIWAISPKIGVLKDLYKEGYIHYFADCRDVDNIKEALKDIYNDYVNNSFKEVTIKEEYLPENVLEIYKSLL